MSCHEESSNSARKDSVLPGNLAANQSSAGATSHVPLQNTVFIHKLYNILEDDDLKDLIWWSPSGISFLIRPTEKFSRALATYFKHTNIASFVRQLNMYGFHKVSNDHSKDLQSQLPAQPQSGSDDGIKIWEFRHSMGMFKRGDIEGLKFIKRRSSRNITTLNGRKNSSSAISISSTIPQGEELESSKQPRPQQQQQSSATPAPAPPPPPQGQPQQQVQWQPPQQFHPQGQQWPQSQFIVNTEEEHPPQSLPPQVGLTAYPSSDSIFNQQFQQQQLETRFAELSQSYSGLRYDYTNLQYRHEGLLEQLRSLNVDTVKLLEFVQSFVSLQGASCDLFNESYLKGEPNKLNEFRQHQKEMMCLEQDMLKFKTNLMQKFQKNLETLQQQQQSSLPQHQPQIVPYGPNVLHGHTASSMTKDMRPLSRSSIPTNSSAAPAFAPHVFSVPSAPTAATFPQPGPFISPQDHFSGPRMVMMNPFETTGQTSTVKRNMSILMDPLSSAPNASGITGSPSRPLPGTIGAQIPRNPSPLVNSSKPPKQETAPQISDNSQPAPVGNSTKRTSRICLKDGTFLLKPNKSNPLSAKRNSVHSDSSSRSESAAVPSVSGTAMPAPTVEFGGPKDAPAIGLPFRTFYSQGTSGDQAKEELTKHENLPSNSAIPSSRLAQNVSFQNSNSIVPARSSQSSPRQLESKKTHMDTPEPSEPVHHTILSPIPSRSDIRNCRASSGVYSLLNTDSASPRSSNEADPNPKKKTKL